MKKSIVLILVCIQTMMLSVIASSATTLTWTPAVLIETGSGTSSSPRIAVDPSGNVMAMWVQSDGITSSIYANRYAVGSGWGTATLLETSDMPADSPQIAADSNGNFIAVWRQAWKTVNGALYGIHANRYVLGTGWGTAATVYENTSRTDVTANGDLQIGVDPNGNAVVVWSVYDWSWNHNSVRANRYVVGTGWGGVTNLSTENVQTAYGPQVALDSTGNAIVVWSQDYSGKGIKAVRYAFGTGWETPVAIEPTTIAELNNSWGPQIAFDPNGNAIVVWYHYGKPGIYTNRYVAGTGWGIAVGIADPGTTSYDEGVRLAIDRNGNAIAVWNQYGGVVYANRYEAGTGWGTTVMVDPAGQDYSEHIAFDQNGNAIAVWGKFSCNSYNILANRYLVGTGWGAVPYCWNASSFVNSTKGDAGPPQGLVIDKNGNATVVWVQYGNIYVSTSNSVTPTPTVSPVSRSVSKDAGTTTFSVSNTGTGTMPWTAAVTSGGTWLSITSGASGTDTGTINCSFTANASALARTATIRVTATGATGSPQDVTVTQAGAGTESLAASFVGSGLYIYNSGTASWSQISSTNPENMIYSGSTLYAGFGTSYGLYKWDGTAWNQLTSANPENMVASGSTLYVDFGASYGLYKWDGSAWSQITSANPENMVVSGSTLYVDFGASYGLYKFDGTSWTQLTPSNPENMVVSGSMLYGDFGALGLYKWDGTSWSQLTSVNPGYMVISGSTLYVDFGTSYGLQKFDGTAWTQLTSVNPENMVTSGATLYVNFGASYGLYKWDGSTWSQLTPANPENMVASGSTLYADFGTLGLYKWDGSSWYQLTGSNPVIMAVSN